ncbi:MAG: polyprenyl diphosphate synthase [Candidatus Cloacimonadaceae bacterium]|nr:polyprenyl diphosphate synthase [Candidatus Cloacimonadaceae bacterium]
MTDKQNYKDLLASLDPERLPRHVGMIMDGNGRWAKQHNRPRLFGHRAGAKSTRMAVELAVELRLQCLTMYAFSTENWARPKSEVEGLMKLLRESLYKEVPELDEQNVHLSFIGSPVGVDPKFWQEIHSIAATTHENSGLRLNVAFNYGGRLEIIEGIKKLFNAASSDGSLIDKLDTDSFSEYLYTSGQPDPDLIIRTSGELRMSNVLLWQSAYSEIYVTPLYWPDFDKIQFCKALIDFQGRKRRYGGIKAK